MKRYPKKMKICNIDQVGRYVNNYDEDNESVETWLKRVKREYMLEKMTQVEEIKDFVDNLQFYW